jgi:hypothetical protein
LRDVLCEAESITKKVNELQTLLSKTSNRKKKEKIRDNIKKLKKAAVDLTEEHEDMKIRKEKVGTALSGLILKV